MLERFYPVECIDSSYDIDYQKYYDKGYRGIIFDIDNTLVPHGAPPTKKAIELFERLRAIGFRTCLISNNKRPRVEPFANAVGSEFIEDAHKPRKDNYVKSAYMMETGIKQTMFVGDQIFTDVFGANMANIHTILVKPIHPSEEIQIRFKRHLEKIVLHYYNKQK